MPIAYSAERLLARAAQMDRQVETWKCNPDYAETLRMDAAALRFMAAAASAPAAIASLSLEIGEVTDGGGQPVVDNAIIFFVGEDETSDIRISSPNARAIADQIVMLWNGGNSNA
jgi:hypothetical protein